MIVVERFVFRELADLKKFDEVVTGKCDGCFLVFAGRHNPVGAGRCMHGCELRNGNGKATSLREVLKSYSQSKSKMRLEATKSEEKAFFAERDSFGSARF